VSVSVVIPTWNRAATLSRAIVSAACQNPAEVVVIDDASADDTPGIVEQLRGIYPCVRYVRHAEKSADWQAAAAEVYPSLVGLHVICLGADDALASGVVDSVGRHPTAAVVFHDYWVAGTDDRITSAVVMGFQTPTELTPQQVLHRTRTHPWATETGIGSGIRLDHLLWLAGRQFWLMGPWSDAIGYAVVAALHGCMYCPGAGAIFTHDPNGYGATGRDGGDQAKYHAAVREFVDNVDLPQDVRQLLCDKRGVPYG